MEHKLHVKKVLLARDKLRPLNAMEKVKKAAVIHEEKSIAQRTGEGGVPDVTTVFMQARNGKTKRVEDSLNADFPIDEPDEKGNTLLLVAAQNCNKKLIELCLNRGAQINHQNAHGNTALHFAMAYDTEVSRRGPNCSTFFFKRMNASALSSTQVRSRPYMHAAGISLRLASVFVHCLCVY